MPHNNTLRMLATWWLKLLVVSQQPSQLSCKTLCRSYVFSNTHAPLLGLRSSLGIHPLRRNGFDNGRYISLYVYKDLHQQGSPKKMVGFELPSGERLVWELGGTGRSIYLAAEREGLLEAASMAPKSFPYVAGAQNGKRHSGLDHDWSFAGRDCVQVRIRPGRPSAPA